MVSNGPERGDTSYEFSHSAGAPPSQELGFALVQACEELLGVEGPTSLASITGRSKGWWSKLQSGKYGRFPTLTEMEQEVIGAASLRAVPPKTRAAWRRRYRDLWLRSQGHGETSRLTVINAMYDPPLEQLQATYHLAQETLRTGEYEQARQVLQLLRTVIEVADLGSLSRPREQLLIQCLEDLSRCETALGNRDAAHEADLSRLHLQEDLEPLSGDEQVWPVAAIEAA